jgi:thioredoxin-related protein
MKKENILVICLIILAAGIILTYIYSKQSSPSSSHAGQTPAQYLLDSKINWWKKGYSDGMATAKSLNKPVFLHFRADWCTFCKKMENTTFADEKVQAELNENFVSIVVDTDRDKKIANQWSIRGVPATWFLESDGTRISQLPGYVGEAHFLKVLKFISSGKYQTMEFNEFDG